LGFDGRSVRAGTIDPSDAKLQFTAPVRWQDLSPFVRWRAAGETNWRSVKSKEDAWYWSAQLDELDLEPLGLQAGSEYEVCLSAEAPGAGGGRVGFPWCGRLRTGHRAAKLSLVQGDGVIEWEGPHSLALVTTNVLAYREAHTAVEEEELVGLLRS